MEMTEEFDRLRRTVIAGLAALPLAGMAGAAAAAPRGVKTSGTNSLVAYFSRSGNTRVVAGLIQRAIGADIFEISVQTPYPADYLQTVDQAKRESDAGFEPPLAGLVRNFNDYQTIFLGFPIWGMTVPPALRSFMHGHNFSGKVIVPFITHGGYGTGNSLSIISGHAPGAKLLSGFSMQADQERTTMERVNAWMSEAGIRAS
jgi:flavodoxin